ncbi:replication initiation factor domain-containing protein [Enterococcus faecium]|uniref:replication initiation factor domain-containing protein n=1 Tax=Enterococcus faecium TaxID=1352 RepID=UPI0015E47786|nr:replication initiation factor domain-containing protein [Enterococcus faecium]
MDCIELKKIRKDLKQSLKGFSEFVGIPYETYRKYESGEREIPDDVAMKILKTVGKPTERRKGGLHVHFDYLKLTFFDTTAKIIIEKVLRMKVDQFAYEPFKKWNYDYIYRLGNISVLESVGDNRRQGTMLEMSGQGISEFELWLFTKDISFDKWLRLVLSPYWYEQRGYYSRLHSTRLDLAIDELYDSEKGNFDLHELVKKEEAGLVWTPFENKVQISSNKQNDETGLTLYYGSRGGDGVFMRFYEKRYELAQKRRESVEEVLESEGIWNRYELELGKKYAMRVLEDFVFAEKPLNEIAIDLLLSKIEVYDEDETYNGVNRLYYEPFYQVFGYGQFMKVNQKKEEFSIETSMRNFQLMYQNTLALFDLYLGREGLRSWIDEMIENAEPSESKIKHVLLEKALYDKGIE